MKPPLLRLIPVNALYIRFFECIIVDPDIKVAEKGNREGRLGREQQSRQPHEKEAECVHAVLDVLENPAPDKALPSVRWVKMVDSKGGSEGTNEAGFASRTRPTLDVRLLLQQPAGARSSYRNSIDFRPG